MNQALSILEKAAIGGCITSAASVITTGVKWKVPVPIPFTNTPQLLPLWAIAGISGVAASVLNDGAHYLIRNEIPISKKAQDDASLYLGALIGGFTYLGAIYMVTHF